MADLSHLKTPKFLSKDDCTQEFTAVITAAQEVTTNFDKKTDQALEIVIKNKDGKFFRHTLTRKNPNLETVCNFFGWDTDNLVGQCLKFWLDQDVQTRDGKGVIKVSPVKRQPALKLRAEKESPLA